MIPQALPKVTSEHKAGRPCAKKGMTKRKKKYINFSGRINYEKIYLKIDHSKLKF